MTRSEIARKILTYMETAGINVKRNTRHWLIASGLDKDGISHLEFREVMNRLHTAGIVSRDGSGKFWWALKTTNWDRAYPFTPVKTNPDYTEVKPKPKHWHSSPPEPVFTEKQVTPPVDDMIAKASVGLAIKVKEMEDVIEALRKEIADVRTASVANVRVLKIELPDGNVVKLKGKVFPRVYDRVLSLAKCRRNILLVGPAGSGKTYLGKLISESLALSFGSVSCTAGMSESHLLGRTVPNLTTGENVFQGAAFLDCFEDGGVFLLDELDAADPNLLLCINTALANGYVNVPNRPKRPRAVRHKDFVCIATANTFGRGATRVYAGRNQLDEATMDRFRIGIVECDYDPSVEAAICPEIGGQDGRSFIPPPKGMNGDTTRKIVELGYNLRETCLYIRHKIEQSGMRRIMSSRFMSDAYVMMKHGGWDMKQVLEAYFEGWTSEEKAKVM
jgi:hypothetical protein